MEMEHFYERTQMGVGNLFCFSFLWALTKGGVVETNQLLQLANEVKKSRKIILDMLETAYSQTPQ